jgi:flagellum-specific ATP synthase
MLKLFDALLADVAATPIDLTPRRYGTVLACDGGLLEMSGLSVPVGALCRVSHSNGKSLLAEVIGFRNGRTLAMLLGDTVMLRPGARVRPEGAPACCRWARLSGPRGGWRRPPHRRPWADPCP